MRLNPDKFTVDESRSNHMASAMKNADCTINQICFFIAMGAPFEICPFFKEMGESAECVREEMEKG